MYTIPPGKSAILPGLKYSTVTLLFGWWSFGWPWKAFQKIQNSINALHINFDGGEDYTKVFSEMDYDEETVWVYNNLTRNLYQKTTIEIIDIIIDLQSEYQKSDSKRTLEGNISFLHNKLKTLNIQYFANSDLEEIVNTIEHYKKSLRYFNK